MSSAPGSTRIMCPCPASSQNCASRYGKAVARAVGKRHKIVICAGKAEHWAAHRAGIDRGSLRFVEHPEEHLEIGKARIRAEFVEHGALLILRHAVQRVEAGKVEIRVDHRLPEGGDAHQALRQILLAVARRQDAGARRRAHQNERAGEARRGKLLGEHGAHGMSEDDRLRRKRVKDCGKLGAILGEADADELLVGSVLVLAMPDQIGRVHRPALRPRTPREICRSTSRRPTRRAASRCPCPCPPARCEIALWSPRLRHSIARQGPRLLAETRGAGPAVAGSCGVPVLWAPA